MVLSTIFRRSCVALFVTRCVFERAATQPRAALGLVDAEPAGLDCDEPVKFEIVDGV